MLEKEVHTTAIQQVNSSAAFSKVQIANLKRVRATLLGKPRTKAKKHKPSITCEIKRILSLAPLVQVLPEVQVEGRCANASLLA